MAMADTTAKGGLRVLPDPPTGNYFVAAYPPFSCWSEESTSAWRRALATPPRSPQPWGLYVHIPFCAERCSYCYYLSYSDRAESVDRTLDALLRELELYVSAPALEGRELDFVYFGGGTPSLLSTARLGRLLPALQRLASWRSAREVTFECAPRSVNPRKLALLRLSGISRVSLGIQQLDDEVLAANGRIHRVADVERACQAIRSVGFDQVNVDLMAGLVGETEAGFVRSLERTLDLEPDSVTLYPLEIPGNTPLYRAHSRGTVEVAGWNAKRRRLEIGFGRLAAAGYQRRSAYTAVRDPERHGFVYQDAQYRSADLIGIGVSAFSFLAGVHHQNRADLDSWLRPLQASRLPLWRAYALAPRERLVREAVLRLKLGGFEHAELADRHGLDPRAVLERPLAELAEGGWIELDERGVRLSREGMLRADRVVRELFLPQHRVERES